MEEIWKPIEGTSGKYKISNLGRVIGQNGRQLKLTEMKIGYLSIAISLEGKPKRHYVHKLVAAHFLPHELDDLVVNHRDGNKHNNVVSNLEFVSRAENASHWAKTSRSSKAGRNRTGYCGRGHKLIGDRVYCLECRKLKAAGIEHTPPNDCNWKEIPSTDYLVSDTGLVWSNKTRRLIRAGVNNPGYKYVNLRVDGKSKNFAVSRLVAETFISAIEEGLIVDHINSDKLDNNVTNLRIISKKANSLHSRKKIRDDNQHGFKFSPDEAAEVKWLALNADISQKEIKELYGMSLSLIGAIKLGKQWSHIEPKEPKQKK